MDGQSQIVGEEYVRTSSISPLAPQDPVLIEMLAKFFKETGKVPAIKELLKIGSKSRSISKTGKTTIKRELGIDDPTYSHWKNGAKKGDSKNLHVNMTRFLIKMLSEVPSSYESEDITRKEGVRKFRNEVIKHWDQDGLREVVQSILLGLKAHEDYLLEREDAETKGTFADLMTAAAPQTGLSWSASDHYVRRLSPETLPAALRPVFEAWGRDQVVDLLVRYFRSTSDRKRMVTLVGPGLSGKSSVIRAAVGKIAEATQESDWKPSLLYVDLTVAETPERALYLALGGRAGTRPIWFGSGDAQQDANQDSAADRTGSTWREAVSYFRSALPQPDPRAGQIVVFERFAQTNSSNSEARQLERLIAETSIRESFVIFEDQSDVVRPPLVAQTTIELPPFDHDQTIAFLTGPCQVAADLAGRSASDLATWEELRHPGPLNLGAADFRVDSSAFRIRTRADGYQDLFMSILNAATLVASRDMSTVLGERDDLAPGTLQSLMAMAVIATLPVSDDVLARSGLLQIPRDGLRRMGWFAPGEFPCLIGFALFALRAAAARVLSDQSQNGAETRIVLERSVRRLIQTLRADFGASADLGIEEAGAWLKRSVPKDSGLLKHVQALIVLASAMDDVSPFAPETEATVLEENSQRTGQRHDPEAVIVRLVIAARGRVETKEAAKANFLAALVDMKICLNDHMTFDWRDLTSLDGALFHGTARFDALDQVLELRLLIAEMLTRVASESGHADAKGGLDPEASASFRINTAELLLSKGNVSAAQSVAEQLDMSLDGIQQGPKSSFFHWKRARLAILKSRLAQEIGGTCKEMARACEYAQHCVRAAPRDVRSWRFLLRTLARYLDIEGEAASRSAVLEATLALLNDLYGPPENWSGEMRGRVASVLRRTVHLERNPDARREIAQRAMKILTSAEGFDNFGLDVAGRLVKARLHAILDEGDAALKICRDLTSQEPSVDAWMLRLRLEDRVFDDSTEIADAANFEAPESAPISRSLRGAMTEAEAWLKGLSAADMQSLQSVRLTLWIRSRRWKAVGSIERAVKNASERQSIPFDRLPLDDRLRALKIEYSSRDKALRNIGARGMQSVDLVHARARNCGQFIRSVAIQNGKEPDVESVLKIYSDGLTEIPNATDLEYLRSEYFRYIWRHEDAVAGFREVLQKADKAELRQAAALSLAKALHLTAIEADDLTDEERRKRLLEAHELTGKLTDTPEKVPEVLLLKSHLAFELGESVDWDGLDDVFTKVASERNQFLPSLIKNLDVLRLADDDEPKVIADALLGNFTSQEVLSSVGHLYFRRGLTGGGNDVQSYFSRATAMYCAVAMLERSWLGTELATTRFALGRTISVAAQHLGDCNPIDGLWIGNAANQLSFAHTKLHLAVRTSAGAFRDKARKWQGIVAKQMQPMEV